MAEESAAPVQVEESGKDSGRTDQNERYSLLVKPEYIVASRPTSLPELPPEERDGGDKDKKKGRKRARDARLTNEEKLCIMFLKGESCKFGDSCKYSHDIKQFLASRPPDISEVEGGCPLFQIYGHCNFGVTCRFASSHINEATGENFTKDPEKPRPPPTMNTISKDVVAQLRKKSYPFKCKRFNEKKRGDAAKETKVEEKPERKEGEIQEANEISGKEDSTESCPPEVTSKNKNGNKLIDLSPLPERRKIIDFSNKVYIAPLTTVGNLPFRRVMKRFGADITCGEMALGTHLLEGKPSEWALLKRHPEEDVFGVQIAAGYADVYTRVSELIEAHTEVDFVDMNLGCPLDLVCNKGCGASLMMREKRLKEAVEGMTKVLSCPVTIKIRTGWDMAKPFAHELVPRIQSWGIDGIGAIMVHGRSRLQRYTKEANWDYISKVATSLDSTLPKIPVIGNGDIFTYTDYEEKVARDGIASCAMLARGALIKPWLPTEIKERRHWDISATERLDILKDFVKFGLEHWGSDQQGVNNTRRFLLEWLSFLHRYVPVGMLEVLPQATPTTGQDIRDVAWSSSPWFQVRPEA